MPMLKRTDIQATITYLGINQDSQDLTTVAIPAVDVGYEGMAGDSHSGLTRQACVRVRQQYPEGIEIRNTRQISALSAEELHAIKQTMDIDELRPEWVGANLVVSGIHDFSQIPPSTRLIANNGTSLVVDMENAPCRYPGDIIDQVKPGKGRMFAKAALGKRGITLWVERVGSLKVGDTLSVHIPPVCNWRE